MESLPRLYERHLALAKVKIEEGDKTAALTHLEEAYQLNQNIEVIELLSNCYLSEKDYQACWVLIQHHRHLFLSNVALSLAYIQVAVGLEKYLTLATIKKQLSTECQTKLGQQIDQVLAAYELIESTKIQQCYDNLLQITTYQPKQQLIISLQIEKLSQKSFVNLCHRVLKEPLLIRPIRTEWFNQLVSLKSNNPLFLSDYEENLREIVPKDVKSLKEVTNYYHKIFTDLADRYQIEQSLIPELRQHLTLQVGYAYPFIKCDASFVITWIMADLMQYELLQREQIMETLTELSDIKKQQKQIDSLILLTIGNT